MFSDTITHSDSDFIVLIDFDETVFKTGLFRQDLWQLIAAESHMPAESVQQDSANFFSDPVLGGYDYAAHISKYDLNPETMWQLLDSLLSATDYLYEDSATFIQHLQSRGLNVSILSFGESRFQHAKISSQLQFLQNQNRFPFEITMQKKNRYIAENYHGRHGVLIDDVPGQDLPEGFTEIQIMRHSDLPSAVVAEGVYQVRTLEQALGVLDELA